MNFYIELASSSVRKSNLSQNSILWLEMALESTPYKLLYLYEIRIQLISCLFYIFEIFISLRAIGNGTCKLKKFTSIIFYKVKNYFMGKTSKEYWKLASDCNNFISFHSSSLYKSFIWWDSYEATYVFRVFIMIKRSQMKFANWKKNTHDFQLNINLRVIFRMTRINTLETYILTITAIYKNLANIPYAGYLILQISIPI